MTLYVLSVENSSGSDIIGAYLNEKSGKQAAADYVEKQEVNYKKKLVKKDNEEKKKLLYVEDIKEDNKKSVYITVVEFELPESVGSKAKKVKDPNAPKKGISAFMLFSNEHRNKVKTENPSLSFGEIGRKVGEAWKALTDKQKQPYIKKAEQDKKRYESEMASYTKVETTVL